MFLVSPNLKIQLSRDPINHWTFNNVVLAISSIGNIVQLGLLAYFYFKDDKISMKLDLGYNNVNIKYTLF